MNALLESVASFDTVELLIVGGLLIAALILLGVLLRVRQPKTVDAMMRSAGNEVLTNFLIPDGNGGEIHIEYALLSPRGVVVIDIKDVSGHVFGSDAMQDWTVISEARRFTFSNPQHALYDRMAALKQLLPDVPVTGFVAFTENADFTKGRPSNVAGLRDLVADLQRDKKARRAESLEPFLPNWDRLRHEAVAAQVGQLLRS